MFAYLRNLVARGACETVHPTIGRGLTRHLSEAALELDHSGSVADAAHELIAEQRYGIALALIDNALASTPGDSELIRARGFTLFAWGRYEEARGWLLQAAEHCAGDSTLFLQVGWTCIWTTGPHSAEPWMRKAIDSEPNAWLPHFGLASALRGEGRIDEAITSFQQAVDCDPDNMYPLLQIGECMLSQQRTVDAEQVARRAISLDPSSGVAWSFLGIVLITQHRFIEATEAIERAYRLDPNGGLDVDAHLNLGIALRESGRLDEALALYERRLSECSSAGANGHYAQALLEAGRYVEGWLQYEFRWLQPPLLSRRSRLGKPVWEGQSLRDKTILLQTEQGIGDVVQFIRYAPHVKAQGATVVLQVRQGIGELAKAFPGVDVIVHPEQRCPDFDYCISVMSLPRVFGTELDTVPAAVPYLAIDPERSAQWQGRLGKGLGLNVGIVWAGDPRHLRDRYRSVSLNMLAPLAAVDGVQFYSLQKGAAANETAYPPAGMRLIDLAPALHDFADTAVVVDQLDLVISVDTSVAHLAGALGKPVWVLVPTPADWRWMRDREDTPWYPTMRLFRQTAQGDWASVIGRVKDALESEVGSRVRPSASRSSSVAAERALVPMDTRNRKMPGRIAIATTGSGLVQYFSDEPLVGDSIRFYGEYLQARTAVVLPLLRPGSRILAVGAGVGMELLSMAPIVGASGHFYVYESRRLFQSVLRQNFAVNGVANVTIMKRLVVGPRAPDRAVSHATDAETRTSETIDELRLDLLDWLSINESEDALAVLRGAAESLWRLRPGLMVAAADANAALAIANVVRDFGYRCWRVDTPLFNPANFNRREIDIFEGKVAVAVIGLPEEREAHPGLDAWQRLA